MSRNGSVGITHRSIVRNGLGLACLAGAVMLPGSASAQFGPTPSFGPASNFATPNEPQAIAVADFDDDGRLDLAIVSLATNVVSVRLGNGAGGFIPVGPPLGIPVGDNPVDLAVGDVNADGFLDIVTANAGPDPGNPGSVTVLLGDGAGGFTPAPGSPFAAGTKSQGIAIGEVTGDGFVDVVVGNSTSNNVSVLAGDGTGVFAAPVNYAVGQEPRDVALAHLNGDGRLDVIVTNFISGSISVLLGNAGGTLDPAVSIPTGAGARSVAVGDLDGDTDVDIAVANRNGASVSVLLGNGDGTFQPVVNYAAGDGPLGVGIADFNVDGKPDVAVSNFTTNTITILTGDGAGAFQPGGGTAFPTGTAPAGVGAGDFNQDTKIDVALPNFGSLNVSVLLNTLAVADLAITKSGPTDVLAGQLVTYTLTVTNSGLSPAEAVSVADPTPPGSTFVSNTGDCVVAFPCGLGTVAVGQTRTITSTFRIGADYALNSFANTATVSTTTFDRVSANDSATATTTVGRSANLALSKSGPATVSAGGNVTYTIAVTNNGPSDAAAVSVADATPPGLTFVSNTGDCTTAFDCALGVVAAGQTKTITSTFTIDVGYAGTALSNTASVTTSTADPEGANNTDNADSTVGQSADLSITKSGPLQVTPGENVAYTLTVTNNGPSNAVAVSVADPTPSGLTFVSNTGDCMAAFPCPLGAMTVGQTRTITATYAIAAGFPGSSLANTATVTATTPDPNGPNNTATANSTILRSADLAISKTGPGSVVAGENVTYTITVTNSGGPSDAVGVTVADTTPPGSTFVSNSGDCLLAFPCNLGGLAVGQTKTITSTFTVGSGYAGNSISNSASVSASSSDPNLGDNTAITTATVTRSANLGITKIGPAQVNAGENVVYTITVTNAGPSNATGVSVDDATPAGLTFVSNAGACVGAFPCGLGEIAAGQAKTITATFSIPPDHLGTTLANTATVTATTPDPSASNNSSTANAAVDRSADLVISKAGPPLVTPGQNVVYTLAVTNNGPSNAASVSVLDSTPPGLTFVSNTGDCLSSFPCSLGGLTVGQTKTVSATFSIDAGYTAATVSNTATVGGTTPDPVSANNTSTAVSISTTSADLAVTKAGPATVVRGRELIYTITVTNAGPAEAAAVQVADVTPAGLTFVSNADDCTTAFPCALGPLAAGATRTITATYSVPASYPGPGPIENTASVTSTNSDPDPANNSATASTDLAGLAFHTVSPCRVLDTRQPASAPALSPGPPRVFTIAGACGVPSTAEAVSINVTATAPTQPGDLRLYPEGSAPPLASAINYSAGQTRANNAVVKLGPNGGLAVLCGQAGGSVHFILDVNGYFE